MKLLFDRGILPLGFKASGISAGIKKSGKKDMALFYSAEPCAAAALFTVNRIQAAPLEVCRRHLKIASPQAVIVNSGNANCMTGAPGLKDALTTAQLAARSLGLDAAQVLVSSTGIIGKPLPMDKIKEAIPHLTGHLTSGGLSQAAQAILTTDTFPKEAVVRLRIGKSLVTIAGIAKGAGMIAPKMKQATMLAYLFTDAAISKSTLQRMLVDAVGVSFNAITIDGCMSTNDTIIALANGRAKNKPIRGLSKDAIAFGKALREVCIALAKSIVRDAEGATKLVEINVKGAESFACAESLAFAVANSNLFKCAMFGSDPNWGRIAAALGSVPSGLQWEKMAISLNKRPVFKNAKPVVCNDKSFLKGNRIRVDIDLKAGSCQKTVYTSDLSYGYVRINADYS